MDKGSYKRLLESFKAPSDIMFIPKLDVEKLTNTKMAKDLACARDKLILEEIRERVGEDVGVGALLGRERLRMAVSADGKVTTILLDNKPIIEFYPLDVKTENKGEAIMFTATGTYKRFPVHKVYGNIAGVSRVLILAPSADIARHWGQEHVDYNGERPDTIFVYIHGVSGLFGYNRHNTRIVKCEGWWGNSNYDGYFQQVLENRKFTPL